LDCSSIWTANAAPAENDTAFNPIRIGGLLRSRFGGAGSAAAVKTTPSKPDKILRSAKENAFSNIQMKTIMTTLPGAILLAGLIPVCAAQSGESKPPVDKSGYTLFNPTPGEHLREMSTDRPDKTESPYTVDAGHFQIELDFVNFTRDHDKAGGADTVAESWAFAPVNLKLGLCNRVDIQFVLETFNYARTVDRVAGTRTIQRGFGDTTTRLKVNLWGDDGGTTALALMPFVKFPTSQDQLGNNSVEGGLIVPLAVELPAGWSVGLMTEFDFLRDEAGRGRHTEFVNTVTFGHDIVGKLGGYVEFWSAVSTERDAAWQGSADVGLTYAVTENVQIDAGVNFGITTSAPDVQPFLGISIRF
jgi:hypothetical protein